LTSQQTALLEEISKGTVSGDVEANIKKVVEEHVKAFTS
jgi:F-type H+-transporting ATPase subunit alpha